MRAPRSISLLRHVHDFRLAPGMHVHVDIAYTGGSDQTAKQLQQEIVLKHEGGYMRIPVIYKSICAQFELRGELDFGVVCAGTDLLRQLSVLNCGTSTGAWSLRIESDCRMKADHFEGELAAGASAVVTLAVPEIDPGEWVGNLQLLSAGDTSVMRAYTIRFQAVTGTVELQGELGQPLHEVRVCRLNHANDAFVGSHCRSTHPVDLLGTKRSLDVYLSLKRAQLMEFRMQMDFGPRLNNDVHKKRVLIMNGSPVPVKYAVEVVSLSSNCGQSVDMERDMQEPHNRVSSFIDAARTRAQMRGRHDVPFRLAPSCGEVPPFDKAVITVTYAPKLEVPDSGFTANVEPGCAIHSFMGKIDLQGASNRTFQIPLKGRCEFQVASVSPQHMHFTGHSQQDLSMTIWNHAMDTTIRYHIRKSPAFFRVDGSQIQALLQPRSAATVTVKYHPKALGLHSGSLSIAVLAPNGKVVEEHAVAVTGACGSSMAGQLDLSTAPRRALLASGHRESFRTDVYDMLNLGLDTWKGLGIGDPGKPKQASSRLWTVSRNMQAAFTAISGMTGPKVNLTPFKVCSGDSGC